MIHFGDICKLSGYELPIVDIITGGSPCQGLSVAGMRKGLDDERSGLFMEQIRIVKEMREHDRQLHGGRTDVPLRPRYLVWENVRGSLSSPGRSDQGKDFQAVLTEIIRIAEPNAPDVPLPDKGKWEKCGCINGVSEDGIPFSVAYKLHDAQFWGVAQRRVRICVLADFSGFTASEIMFDPKFERTAEDGKPLLLERNLGDGCRPEVQSQSESLRGDSEESGEEGQAVAGDTQTGVGEPMPINTMVGTRTTDEKRTTMGIGNPGDPQFTLSAAHEHAVCYTTEEGDFEQ